LVVERVLEAVHEMGLQDKDVRRAILTHIHLDHAAATGWLVKRLPHMQVYVHDRGLKHLNNPSRLIDSAKLLYGNLENITILHGEILPVPVKNLIPVRDEELDVGGVCLKIFDAPGHAPHHLGIFEPESGCLFAGEALGHYHLPPASISRPPKPQ
jgi:glyoxylase-like metal-dependent hydrolase (beta-lactamase superfamily II)